MNSNIRIGIISDPHKKYLLLKDSIEYLKTKKIDYLLCAGDIVIKKNLDLIHNSKINYICVFGNNDNDLIQYSSSYNIFKEPYYFKIGDIKIKLMHIPIYLNGDSNIVIYGHTHQYVNEYINDTLFLNPGEVCAREKNLTQCIFLKITKKEYIIEYNYKHPEKYLWDTKTTKYKR